MVALNFSAANVQPNQALEAIPSGQYPVIISASQEKPTKAGDGSYIELEMTVQGGQYNGRKLFDRLNIRYKNQTAVDIAYSTLSAICHVTGRMNIQDTQQLHGVPFVAVAVKKERDDQPGSGNMTNEVKGYKDINGNDPGHGGQSGAQTQQAPNWAGGQQPPQNTQQPPQNTQQPPPQQQQNYQAPPPNSTGPTNGQGQQPWNNGQQQPPAQQQQVPQQQYQPPVQQQQAPQGGPGNGQTPPPWATQ